MKALIRFLPTLLIVGLAHANDPTPLPFVGGMPGMLEKSAVSAGHAFCTTSAGLLVLDVSDPTLTVQVAMLPLPGWGRSIAVCGDHAYLLAWDTGLAVIDVGDPTAPGFTSRGWRRVGR